MPSSTIPRFAAIWLLAISSSSGAPSPCGSSSTVTVQRLDSAWLTPDALYDAASGTLHVVYGTADKDAYYTSSKGAGGSFSTPTKLNSAGLQVTTTMGERGPKITRAAGGRLVVVWSDLWTGAGCRVYARSAYSDDNGRSWSAPASVAPKIFGLDGLSVAAGGAQVVATFHVNISTSPPPNATSATYLHYALSLDGAETWQEPQVVVLDKGVTPAIACSMCMTRPRFDAASGDLLVSYRAAINNVRDFRVVRAQGAAANDFSTTVVNPRDNWVISYCPMNGPELTLAGGTQLVAFMSEDANHVYFSSLGQGEGAFAGHVPTPAHEANERYPTAVASPAGDVAFVWNVGPMAVSGDAAVKWACYAPGNATAAQSGVIGRSFAGTKATALALDGNSLLILTTAA